LVSVIIPTYNQAQYLVEAVESVLAQTYKNIEIIVVDDGSTDGTEEVLSPYMDRIRYFYQENRGCAAARNVGIRHARGKYLSFLDHDDIFLPEKIELQVRFLEENYEYGFVHSNFYIFNENDQEVRIRHQVPPPSGYVFPRLFMGSFIGCLTMFMRKKCIEKSGGFDEQRQTCSDCDLWLRVARHFKGAYIHKVLAVYRFHASSVSTNHILVAEEKFKILTKVLRLYPSAIDEIGREAVSRRFCHLLRDLGYLYFDAYELPAARSCFRRAVGHSPRSWSSYAYYLATWLPVPVIKALRQIKRRASRLITVRLEPSGGGVRWVRRIMRMNP
jgi:glycosyltransferase involved in cell wall biosynthesis